MNIHFPARRRWANRLAHLAVVIVVLALAAATFVLSYTGVHSIALQAAVPTRLARIYPGVFDAALVIACAAALMLREGRWWARAYAWLSIILVIAVVGAADAVHAMNMPLPRRETAGVVAAAPWVLVLLGFSLWMTMLRQSRTHGQPPQPVALEPTAPEPTAPQPTAPEPTAPALPQLEATPAEPAAALPISESTRGDEETPVSGEAITSEEAIVPEEAVTSEEAIDPEETAVLQETTASEETAPAEVTAEHEPAAAAERESAPSSETPVEEAARTDEPSAPPHDYWDTDNADESDSQPATAPPMAHGRRVPAALDEEEPPPPFATVPRLRRVRSTPTPPEDDDKDQDHEG